MYDTHRQFNSTRVSARMTVPNDKPVHADAPRPANPAPTGVSQPAPAARPAQPKPVPPVQSAAAQPVRPAGQPHAAPGGLQARPGGPVPGQRPGPAGVPGRPVPQMPLPQAPVRPTASNARLKARHVGLVASFLVIVLLPILISAWYLYARAEDQYASYMGFTVRTESGPAASELLGGLTSLVGTTSSTGSDTDILYKFIQSHDLVQRIDDKLDLRAMWSKSENDPIFSYTGNASLEDLLTEWERKVRVYYNEGMIDLRVVAFQPKDAQAITQAIYDEGTVLVNELNNVAREDALRYARHDLDEALERLREARQAMTEFRNRHQLVDPTANVAGQVGVVSTLEAQLAEQLVALGLLKANAQANDPRIEQTQLRIDVIREQIADERQKFGSETATGEALSTVVGQFESLTVDREFAEQTYIAALAAYDAARAEAARQTRYLAAYVKPTLAQDSEFPKRPKLLSIMGGFLLLIWVVGVLTFYSLRDRR
jgi:capsular polysaccharide transport system permease protein